MSLVQPLVQPHAQSSASFKARWSCPGPHPQLPWAVCSSA